MIMLYTSPNIVELNLIKQRLEDVEIQSVILDEHMGGMGLGNIYPRLMVLEEDLEGAKAVLAKTGL